MIPKKWKVEFIYSSPDSNRHCTPTEIEKTMEVFLQRTLEEIRKIASATKTDSISCVEIKLIECAEGENLAN